VNQPEKEYIEACKRLIEEKFHFVHSPSPDKNGNGSLRQRDLEYLADNIEEHSGVKLSLSTLKRLWKKDYEQTPHPSTLDALVSVLGYKTWQAFKLSHGPLQEFTVPSPVKKTRRIFSPWTILPVVFAVAVIMWLIAFRSGKEAKIKPIIRGPVEFTGNKTVSQGVPNTVIFNYDLSNVEADSFFFQQSWNNMERVRIDPKGHSYSNIYYYPGFHKAKLIANDSILKRFRVHITTDGWLPVIGYRSDGDNGPVYVKKNKPSADGAFHISTDDLIASKVDINKDFSLSYFNIREFENTHSDNFSIDTRVKCDSSNNTPCPGFELVIMCEEHIFFVRMMHKGCERDIALKMGEVVLNGVSTDLSAFGRDIYQWQHLKVEVVNKKATISIDGKNVYTVDFKNDLGKIVGLAYHFTGTAAIDYVRLKNGEGRTVYDDEFEETGASK
jgi:hypothetical protein